MEQGTRNKERNRNDDDDDDVTRKCFYLFGAAAVRSKPRFFGRVFGRALIVYFLE